MIWKYGRVRGLHLLNRLLPSYADALQGNITRPQRRELSIIYLWLCMVFNAVDKKRLKLMGPDLVCAEWLLRNGAAVRFKGHETPVTDYNILMEMEQSTKSLQYRVEEIYAKKCPLNFAGFEHLKDCAHVSKITLIECPQINDYCIRKFQHVQDTLENLEMRSCHQVGDNAVMNISKLRNLKWLILSDLTAVRRKADCEAFLRKELTNCKITFNE